MKIIASHLLAKKLAKMWWCLIVTALTTIPLCTNSSILLGLPMKIKGQTIINILRVSKQECIKIHKDTKVFIREHSQMTFTFFENWCVQFEFIWFWWVQFRVEPEFETFLFTDAVTVNWGNIQASQQSNFDILNFDTFDLPYDWASISHFRSKAYRTQKSVGHTIESKVS